MTDTSDLAFLADTLTSVGRHSEALDALEKFVHQKQTLDLSERRLFERAFKRAIDPARDTLRSLVAFYNSESDGASSGTAELIKTYQDKSHAELNGLCDRAISLTKSVLLPNASDVASKVFYLKALGDFHRYIAEFETEDKHRDEAAEFYKQAVELSDSELRKSDPLRLSLILNYAIFLFDHMKQTTEPIEMLQRARKDAEIDMPQLTSQQHQQALEVLVAMRTNLAVWCDDQNGN